VSVCRRGFTSQYLRLSLTYLLLSIFIYMCHTVQLSRYSDSSTGWTVRGSNPRSGEFIVPLHTCCEDHPALFPKVKWPERGFDHPTRPSVEVANGWQLYLHLPSVSAQARHGLTFTYHAISLSHVCKSEVSGPPGWCVVVLVVADISKKRAVVVLKYHCAT